MWGGQPPLVEDSREIARLLGEPTGPPQGILEGREWKRWPWEVSGNQKGLLDLTKIIR